MRSKQIRTLPLHPFLVGAYAVLALLAHNITEVSPKTALPALVAVLAASGLSLVFFFLILRDWQRAAVVSTILIVLFFSYGHVYKAVKSYAIGSLILGRHRYLLVVWLVIALVLTVIVARRPGHAKWLNSYLNFAGMILVCLPTFRIASYQVNQYLAKQKHVSAGLEMSAALTPVQPVLPDIYYIVLDGYSRTDVLREVYGIDNREFLERLRDMGFYVASCSRSNYNETRLSLTSTFNMEYIQLLPPYAPDKSGRPWVHEYLKHNQVRTLLEGLGYRTIVFYHVYDALLWDDAEVYRVPGVGLMLNPFEIFLLKTTPSLAWLDSATARLTDRDKISRLNTLYALSQLSQLPGEPGPKFVFAHLMVPHSPFVFGANGEEVHIPYDPLTDAYSNEDFWHGYRGQVLFINQQILPVLAEIITRSSTPPIIILASDHGTDHTANIQNDFLNLGAYYLPGTPVTGLYDSLSPVNAFRILFNAYFGGQYELLPDKSFFCQEGATYFVCTEVELATCPEQ